MYARSNLIQYGKQQTVRELNMDKIVLRAKWKYPDKKYELWYFNCVFLAHFFCIRVSYKWNVLKIE